MSYKNRKRSIREQNDFIRECEEVREELGMTKCELSRKALNSPTNYHYYLNAVGNMTASTGKAIAEALGKRFVMCLVDADE